jgi:cytochrome c553
MRRASACLVALALGVAGGPAWGADDWQEKLATCLACHGQDGISQMPEVPSLAGQPDLFTQWQLVYFRDSIRASEVMVPSAQALTDAEVRALGAYFASLAPPKPPGASDPAPDLSAAGAKLAAAGRCGSCHLPSFAGQGEMPRLAGQREEVLAKALKDYKSGARRGRGIAAMPEITFGLSEDAILALAHFLSRQ